jgi:hypothetical protein
MKTELTRRRFVGATAATALAGSVAAITHALATKDSIDGDEPGLTTARNTGLRVADLAVRLAK